MSDTNNPVEELLDFKIKGILYPLRLVQGGSFLMGGEEFDDEMPKHQVTIPTFYMGQYVVTQDIYQVVMGENPSYNQNKRKPVENVSWDTAQDFMKVIRKKTGKAFRLPAEAEWEYAARGGIHQASYAYCGSDELSQVGWYDGNSGREIKPVGLLLPNELGLYDMSGNVLEWCEDDWQDHYDYPERLDNGQAWTDSPRRAYRVGRGGSSSDYDINCRPAYRDYYSPGIRSSSFGFRLALSASSG